jgi:autotransporter translocation and assembly factor TamB
VNVAALLPEKLEGGDDVYRIALERADVTSKVKDIGELEKALGMPPSARGSVSVAARASGRLDHLTVKARVESPRVTQKELRLTGVRAELGVRNLDPRRLPGPAVGSAEVSVASIVNGPSNYGKAAVVATLSDGGRRADVRFNAGGKGKRAIGARGALSAVLGRDSAKIQFRELRIAMPKMVWQGRGGRLEVADGGRKLSANLGLSSKAGSVKVSTSLRRNGDDLRGPVRWQVSRIDLARLLGSLGMKGLRGKVSAKGEIRLPAGPGKIEATAANLAWPGAPQPIDGTLKVSLARRKLDATVGIDAGELGTAKAELAMRTPAVLTDGAAWQKLRASAVQSVAVKADKVDVARLVHTTSKDGAGNRLRSALAELDIEAGPGLETGRVSLAVKGAEVVATTDVVVPIDTTVEAKLERAQVTTTAKVDAGKHGKVELDAAVAVPGQPLDGASWSKRGLELLRSANIRVRDVDLSQLERLGGGGGGRSVAMSGMVQADVTAGPAARSLTTKVSFRDVRAVDLAAPLSGEFTAKGEARNTDLALSIRLANGPLLDGALRIGVGADDVRGFDFERLNTRLRSAALRGQLRIPDQPVVRLASALDATPQVSGRLSGELTVAGTVSRPVLSVRVDAPGFTAEGIRFDRLQARANYQAGPWRATIDARQSDGGAVQLKASGGADERAPLKVHLSTRRLRLGLFTPLWKRPGGTLTHLTGLMHADLDIGGTPERPIIDGSVQVRQGEARLANFLRPVTGATVDVKFRRSQAQIAVRADSRPGKLQVDSTLDLRQPAQTRFTARLTAKDLPVQAGSQLIELDGKINTSGAKRGPMWDMTVLIERGVIVRLPSQKNEQLHDVGELDDVKFVDAEGLAQEEAREEIKKAAGPSMRVRIKTDNLVAVRSRDDMLRLDLKINLTTTQVGAANTIQGNVEVVRGWIALFGQRYDVERGWVRFNGEIPPNPGLDIRVAHAFPDTIVYIDVGGTVQKPIVEFASDGGQYDQGELLAMVLGGGPSAGGGDGASSTTQEKAESAGLGLVANQVAGVARDAGLPVDVLRFGNDPEEGGVNEVTVGKWLSDRLFIAFRYRNTQDEDKNPSEGTFQHFFTRDWMWEGVVGTRENSIDLLWIVPVGK